MLHSHMFPEDIDQLFISFGMQRGPMKLIDVLGSVFNINQQHIFVNIFKELIQYRSVERCVVLVQVQSFNGSSMLTVADEK